MTTIDSATAHEYIKHTEFASTPEIVFDRVEVEKALAEVSRTEGVATPSAKSYLDWARRHGVVEPVAGERGHYRWAASTEDQAAEIGRQMAQEHVYVTDMDPEHPMILQDEEGPADTPLEAETCEPHTEDLSGLSDVADVRAYIVTRQTRIPRKEKKRMKKLFRDVTGVEKVRFVHADDLDVAWEMANR